MLELVGLKGRIEGLPEGLHTDVVAADLSEVCQAVSRTHLLAYHLLACLPLTHSLTLIHFHSLYFLTEPG